MRRPGTHRVLWVAPGVAVAGLAGWLALRAPATERDWTAEHARQPTAAVASDTVTVRDVRAFTWRAGAPPLERWETRTYDLRRLDRAWLGLVPLSASMRAPAHLFLSFGFGDSTFVTVSAEGRREAGETFGLVAGMLRRFELIVVVADERDFFGRRVVQDGDPIYLFPVRATPAQLRALFTAMLGRATALDGAPEFYHTAWNNCTTNIVDQVNALAPGRIPPGWRTLLPGYADDLARALGLIEGGADAAAARARYRVDAAARAALDAPDFSRRLRGALPPP